MKHFLSLFILGSFLAHAENVTLSGQHNGLDYLFVLNEQWEDVTGSWGHWNYKIEWNPYSHQISGSTGGADVDLEINPISETISGAPYCGYIDLKYLAYTAAIGEARVKGSICQKTVDLKFKSDAEFKAWINNNVLSALLSEFPPATQAPVTEFFAKRLSY